MPRHPDTVVAPNTAFSDARGRLGSPHRPGQRMSRSELADAVNAALDRLYPGRDVTAHYVYRTWIGKIERGEHRWPSEERRAALRDVLRAVSDDDLGLFSPRRSATPISSEPATRIENLPATMPHLGGIEEELASGGPETVGAWLRELDQLTLLTPATVASGVSTRIRVYLDVLDRLQVDGARRHLAGVDAHWSEFMSWISDNTGEPDGGLWLARAHRRAAEIDAQVLGAYTLMRHSQRALADGDIRTAIRMSRRSLTHGPVPPRTHVLCLIRLAESLAASGDDDAHNVIALARRQLRRAGVDATDQIARHCDLRYVTAADARCRHLLGDTTSAASILEEVLADQTAAAVLDTGLWHVYLGECYLTADPEGAAHHGTRALRMALAVGSYRIIRAAQPLAVGLRPHRDLDIVNAFLASYRGALTGR
ncbi:hypothetical protein GCM10022251_81120 [Phytohabitans flavus]|uniref:Uncharacterized protein n=1 Tax=Phytohabitans flavus TaxID=1076124 RepID=A0A6F8XL87_9ACTN|nr:hypothetical protein [Phytohabitans flavus]BCB74549.1 hypothetical protein Pflav_009590 [Phytohabitans flavus]